MTNAIAPGYIVAIDCAVVAPEIQQVALYALTEYTPSSFSSYSSVFRAIFTVQLVFILFYPTGAALI